MCHIYDTGKVKCNVVVPENVDESVERMMCVIAILVICDKVCKTYTYLNSII
jgi:hypothetical protein